MVYGNSDTDMVVAMPCPSPTYITDGLSPPCTECAKLAQLDDLDQGAYEGRPATPRATA
jgi:hypothetical protein